MARQKRVQPVTFCLFGCLGPVPVKFGKCLFSDACPGSIFEKMSSEIGPPWDPPGYPNSSFLGLWAATWLKMESMKRFSFLFLKTSKTHWFFNEIGWCRGSRREGLALLFGLFGLLLGSLGHLLGNPVLRRKSKAETGVLFKTLVRLGGRFWTPSFPK